MKNEELTTLKFSYPEGQERTVRVYVPAHGDDETLPVIYMTDGQNLFEDEISSFGGRTQEQRQGGDHCRNIQ